MKATSKQILNSYKKKKHIPIEAGNYPVEQYISLFLDEGQKFAFILQLKDFYDKPKRHAISLLLKGGIDIIPELYLEWIEQILKFNRSLIFYFVKFGLNISIPIKFDDKRSDKIHSTKIEYAKFDDYLIEEIDSIELKKMGKILSQIRKIRNRYEHDMTIDENGLMFRSFKKNNIRNDFNLTFNQSKFLLSELQNKYCETFPNHQQIIPNLN